MNEPRPRVFVSSVMKGYEQYRKAARKGISQAGCDPVLAEDFAAQDASPRSACLNGVQSVDAMVLLLGSRYGWEAPSGFSATQEEYHEACRRHIPILVFIEEGSNEPMQQRFVEEIEDYVDGYFRKTFQTPDELQRLVEQAVISANPRAMSMNQGSAESRIRAELDRQPPVTRYSVSMRTIWTTLRDEEVVDPIELYDEAFKNRLLQIGHGCTPPLFIFERSIQCDVTALGFRAAEKISRNAMPSEDGTVVTINCHGTLTVQQTVTDNDASQGIHYDPFMMLVLDPNMVRDCLTRAWSFAAAWWTEQDQFLRHNPLLYNVGLYNIGGRTFMNLTDRNQRSTFTLTPECPHNPLVVENTPKRVSRKHLESPNSEINRIVKMIEIRFREWAENLF